MTNLQGEGRGRRTLERNRTMKRKQVNQRRRQTNQKPNDGFILLNQSIEGENRPEEENAYMTGQVSTENLL